MTPQYPAWVNTPKGQPSTQLAKKRLTFIIRNAALQHDGSTSYRSLSLKLGMSHSTFCIYIDRGYFSKPTAVAIEKLVGRELAPHELLCDPLQLTTWVTGSKAPQ